MIRLLADDWPSDIDNVKAEIQKSYDGFSVVFMHGTSPIAEWFSDGGEFLSSFQAAQSIADQTLQKLKLK